MYRSLVCFLSLCFLTAGFLAAGLLEAAQPDRRGGSAAQDEASSDDDPILALLQDAFREPDSSPSWLPPNKAVLGSILCPTIYDVIVRVE